MPSGLDSRRIPDCPTRGPTRATQRRLLTSSRLSVRPRWLTCTAPAGEDRATQRQRCFGRWRDVWRRHAERAMAAALLIAGCAHMDTVGNLHIDDGGSGNAVPV